MDYVIIGNSAAGIGGIEGIRSQDQTGKITVVSTEPYHTYSRPLISYYLAGKVDQEQMKFRPADFYKVNNVETVLGKKAIGINADQRKVELENGSGLRFDRLLLATGGTPFIPPIKGNNRQSNIYTFIKLDDTKAIAAKVNDGQEVKAVILGAGLIGLKAAEALVKMGVKVTVVELADRVLSAILDHQAAALVQTQLEAKGINFALGDTISEFIGEDEVKQCKLKSGPVLDCDLVIMAVGVRPEISLVKGTEIEYNRGILVNKKMETVVKHIYAAGDVAEGFDMLRGAAGVIPIWPNAYQQGLTAGVNMADGNIEYNEGFARNSIGFFGLPMITAGIVNPEEDEDYEIKIETAPAEGTYRKLVMKNNRLVGFIYLNKVDRAGILTGLIKDKKDIGEIKEEILAEDFGYLTFDTQWRREKLWR